ncbi:MAG: hypothetical protein E3J72_14850 [Planctomycetota bacterium]|nr:MAG: hypothetical protein E3J72_14850 [Planctomycetota bacterium]
MDWLNKEKIVFLVSLLLVVYALASVFGTRTASIDAPEPPPSKGPDENYIIQWGTEKTLLAGYFGDLWTGGRDPFHEKETTDKLDPSMINLKNPPFLDIEKLRPVPTFIGAPPRPKEISKASPGGGGGFNE